MRMCQPDGILSVFPSGLLTEMKTFEDSRLAVSTKERTGCKFFIRVAYDYAFSFGFQIENINSLK